MTATMMRNLIELYILKAPNSALRVFNGCAKRLNPRISRQ